MSRALAVFHGRFGRATVYQLNRPFNVHAHREGHLIFHVGGTPAQIDVCDQRWRLTEDSVVAVNPWEPHNFLPTDVANGAIFFVLYVNAEWFAPDAANSQNLRFGRTHFKRTDALDKHIRRAAALVCGAPSLRSLDCELRQLIDSCYEESWQQSETAQSSARRRRDHGFSRSQIHQADVRKPRRRDRTGLDRPRLRPFAAAFLPAVPYPDRRHASSVPEHADHGTGARRAGRNRSRRSPTSASISASPRRAASPASSPPMSEWRRPITAAQPRCCVPERAAPKR